MEKKMLVGLNRGKNGKKMRRKNEEKKQSQVTIAPRATRPNEVRKKFL